MAPRIGRQSIWKLGRAAGHVLLVIATKIRDVFRVARDVEVQADNVCSQIDRYGSIKLEPACIQTVTKPEIVGRIFGCGLGQNVSRDWVDINQCSAGRRVGVVVKASRQAVEISRVQGDHGKTAVRFARNELQQALPQTRQRHRPVNRNLAGVTTALIVVEEEKAVLLNRATQRAAEVVSQQHRSWQRLPINNSAVVEEIVGGENRVAMILKQVSMPLIVTMLRNQLDLRT